MNEQEFVWNVNYWTDRFEEEINRLQPLIERLNNAPIADLTYEERFQLREALNAYRSYVNLLRDDLEKYNATPPVPFYKKFFHK